jgi:arylsulfatase
MVRWPGQIKPASVSNEIMHHMDWLPTFGAVAGDADLKNKLLKGFKVGNTQLRAAIDRQGGQESAQ